MRDAAIDREGLGRASVAELEAIFGRGAQAPMPRGSFRGRLLHVLDTPGAQAPLQRVVNHVAFGMTPFGIDFDRRAWWFFAPWLTAGRFAATEAARPSRWRPGADVFALDYSVSRLPKPMRGALYDELCPLGPALVLGLGGIDRERGRGDHFFFALTPVHAGG